MSQIPVYDDELSKSRKQRISERKREFYRANKIEISASRKQYYAKNRERISCYRKEYNQKNRERISAQRKQYRNANKSKIAARSKSHRNKIKAEIMRMYGGKCGGCGADELAVLSLDHINDDGAKERLHEACFGNSFYRKLLRQPRRHDLQVLCMNCQHRKIAYGPLGNWPNHILLRNSTLKENANV